MAAIIKTMLGGVVARNVKMQVFIDPKLYLEVISEAKHYNINPKNDSELIRKILNLFLKEMPMKTIIIEQQRTTIRNREGLIEKLEGDLNVLKQSIPKPRKKKKHA